MGIDGRDYSPPVTKGNKEGTGAIAVLEADHDRHEDAPVDPKPDSPRYAAMGDAISVPVSEWIGIRLKYAIELEHGANGRGDAGGEPAGGSGDPPA